MTPCSSRSVSPARVLAGWGLAALLLTVAGAAQAQDCGLAAGYFQVDGQFFSSGSAVDWAKGLSGQGVFDSAGNPVLTPALHDRDEEWSGSNTDPDAFASGNKNNDDISASGTPWTWGPGSGPAKNDLTDVYAHSATKDGNLWLFLGATTRSNNGASHVDFEFNQRGFTRTGTTSGSIIGNGPDAGRTRNVDFIVSVDYTDGGNVPVVTCRQWQAVGTHFEFVLMNSTPGNAYVCTNTTAIQAPPWGAIDPNGNLASTLDAYQFVEIAVNLTGMGIDPAVFCTDASTLLFKTRSSPSFTAELKDFGLYQFSIVQPPSCTITADRAAVCQGESAELCAPVPPEGADYSYAWSGPGGPFGGSRCITANQSGTYSLVVTDNRTGCASDACTFDLTVNPLPACTITFDNAVICEGSSASFCGPTAPAGSVYSYHWSGPAASYPDQRCLPVTEAGTYLLTVVNETTGCSSSSCSQSLTVNPRPPSTISGTGLLCQGLSGQLCGPDGNYDYAWTGPGGPYANARCITVSLAGRYSLVVTDRGTGCVSLTGTHDVIVADNPGCAITGPTSICPDGDVQLCGPEGTFTYTWSGPEGALPSTRCVTVHEPGTYSLQVDDPNGCVSHCQHVLTLDQNVTVSDLQNLALCTGDRAEFCVTASGTGPLLYQWYKNGQPISGATANCYVIAAIGKDDVGAYRVDVTGKCNEVSRSATLSLADVSVAPLTDLYLCQGQRAELCARVTGRGPYAYSWKKDGQPIPGATDSCLVMDAVSSLDEAMYCVTVQGFCGSPVTQCARIYVGDCVEYCGLTQGFYGNPGGKWNGLTTIQLLDQLITPDAPLVVGVRGKRSLTFPDGSEECIIALLPGGGPSSTLSPNVGDAMVDPVTCDITPPIQAAAGRLHNSLLAQAITLSLNMRLDPNLANMPLCEFMIMIPILPGPDGIRGTADDVPDNLHPRIVELSPAIFDALDALLLPHTAYGALMLGNRALANDIPPVPLGDITQAMGSINDLVDACALTIHCETPTASLSHDSGRHIAAPTAAAPGVGPLGLTVFTPNPLRAASHLRFALTLSERSRVRAGVYSVSGREVSRIPEQTLEAGDQTFDLDLAARGSLPSGIYFLRLETRGEETGRGLNENRKLVMLP
jgi:hypothetical protein